jgi:hypothetical protein
MLLKQMGVRRTAGRRTGVRVDGVAEIQFRRVEYNVEKTIRLLREIRWDERSARETYHYIFKNEHDVDPITRRLHHALKRMTMLLPEQIEQDLIRHLT